MAVPNIIDTNTFEPLGWQIEPWRDSKPIMLLSSGSGTGKSMVGDTHVTMFDGSVKMLKDVRAGDKVLSFTKDGHVREGTVKAFESSGVKEVIEIKTERGRVLRLSKEHPLRSGPMYTQAGRLKVGDHLHSPWSTGFGTYETDYHKVMLVTYFMLGGRVDNNRIIIELHREEDAKLLKQTADFFGCELYLFADRPSNIKDIEIVDPIGKLTEVIKESGLYYSRPDEHDIPFWVYNLNKKQLTQLVNRAYNIRGWAYTSTNVMNNSFGISSSSERIIQGMVRILHKYGIHGITNTHIHRGAATYSFLLKGQGQILRFIDSIPDMWFFKQQIDQVVDRRDEEEYRNSDYIPTDMIDHATIFVPHIIRNKHFRHLRNIIRSKNAVGIKFAKLRQWGSNHTMTSELKALMDNDMNYDRIMSIVNTGVKEEMFDIEVEEYENYCAGGVDSHNSRLAAEKIHAFLLRYPGSTGLVVRKTRASMVNSTIAFFKHTVIGNTPDIIYRPAAFRFDYPNGSALIMGGMKDEDQREHIRSIGQNGAVDIAWMEEATQFEENDYNEILARMRGVAGPFTQVMLTTNPEGPMHWIYINLIMDAHKDERVSLYQPSVYDNTHNSADYIKNNLERLTGVQRARLLEGRWAQATGVVFDNWNDYPDREDTNVTYEADYIPGGGMVFWWIDDGVTGEMKNGVFTARSHPRAILFAQMQSDGRLNIFDENFQVGKVATDHLEEMIQYSEKMGYALPAYIVRDRAAASLGLAVRDMGFKDTFNSVKIDESITEMYSWIDPGDSGIRRLRAHPRCKHFRNEMLNFGRNNKTGRIVKAFDHGVDAARYGVWDNVASAPVEIDISNYYQDNYEDLYSKQAYGRPSRRTSGIDIATY